MLNKVGCNFDNIQFVAAPPLRHEPRCEELDGGAHAIFLLGERCCTKHYSLNHIKLIQRNIIISLLVIESRQCIAMKNSILEQSSDDCCYGVPNTMLTSTKGKE